MEKKEKEPEKLKSFRVGDEEFTYWLRRGEGKNFSLIIKKDEDEIGSMGGQVHPYKEKLVIAGIRTEPLYCFRNLQRIGLRLLIDELKPKIIEGQFVTNPKLRKRLEAAGFVETGLLSMELEEEKAREFEPGSIRDKEDQISYVMEIIHGKEKAKELSERISRKIGRAELSPEDFGLKPDSPSDELLRGQKSPYDPAETARALIENSKKEP